MEKKALLARWLDNKTAQESHDNRIDWLRCLPFIGIHCLCLGAWWVGVSPVALSTAIALYVIRLFAITGFYHRYFSHRAFKTSRGFQFVMAVAGNSAVQRGPIWWAAHHRNHHRYSEKPKDLHSPHQHGYWRSHMGWFMTGAGFKTDVRYVRDWLRYPELRALDRFDWVVPFILLVALAGTGVVMEHLAPWLETSVAQMVVWGFGISTVAVYHVTYTINSLAHGFGSQRFSTGDDSRNNLWLALLTFGEGWHNNHHHYPSSARQGFRWWEIDLTYYALVLLSWTGLIRDLRQVPAPVLSRATIPQ